jgi:hypothetical protein
MTSFIRVMDWVRMHKTIVHQLSHASPHEMRYRYRILCSRIYRMVYWWNISRACLSDYRPDLGCCRISAVSRRLEINNSNSMINCDTFNSEYRDLYKMWNHVFQYVKNSIKNSLFYCVSGFGSGQDSGFRIRIKASSIAYVKKFLNCS